MRPGIIALVRAWLLAVAELRRRKRAGLPVEPVTVPLVRREERPQ